jgi:hypothetical protein
MIKYYFLLLVAYLAAALIVTYQNQFYIVPIAVISMLIIDHRAFRPFLRLKFIFFLALLVFGTPLLLGEKDAHFFRIPYSSAMFQISLIMFYRSIIILGAIKIFTNKISLVQLSTALHKIKLKKFGEALTISLETLPEIKTITRSSIGEFRKKEKSKNFIREIFDFVVHLLIKILKFAEDYHGKSVQNKVGAE